MFRIRATQGANGGTQGHGSRRPLLGVLSLSMFVVALSGPGVHAQDADGEAFCRLLTAKEIRGAFGSKVEAAPGYGSCDWYPTGASGHLQSLNASWNDMSLADTEAFFGDGDDLMVADRPALFIEDGTESILLIEIDPGVLMLDAQVDPDFAARVPLTNLGELAVGRADGLPEPPGLSAPVPEPSADPVATAFCAALTAEEAGAAMGADVAAGTPAVATNGVCEWVGTDVAAGFVYLSVGWSILTIDEVQALDAVEEVAVGDRRAWYTDSAGPALLFMELDDGLLVLTAVVPDDVEATAALRSIAELLVSRAASLPRPPVLPGAPSPAADDELESWFPKTVGGQPMTVQSSSGGAALTGLGAIGTSIEAAVASQGLSLDDASVALGISADFHNAVIGVRAPGFDAAAGLLVLLESLGGTQEANEVAGKAITRVQSGNGQAATFYANDDVIWLVQAEEPALTEIVGALP